MRTRREVFGGELRGWRFTSPDGRCKPITVDRIELFDLEAVPVTRYRYRGNTIPTPWTLHDHAAAA